MSHNPYKALFPLFKEKSNLLSIEEFHSKINIVFHNIESKHYDSLQEGMWTNLPEQLALLLKSLDDIVVGNNLKVLDVGCGTGLATSILLKTALSSYISDVTLLDTSPGMIRKAIKRSKKWDKNVNAFCGHLCDLDGKFDLIIVSSVLHHIPNLEVFFNDLNKKLNKNGILITLQDPLSESVNSNEYENRCELLRNTVFVKEPYTIKKIWNGLLRRIKAFYNPIHYMEEVNNELIKQNIVHTKLEPGEMWSVTDIHVEGLPYSNKKGISIKALEKSNKELQLLNYVTYCFFGPLKYYLPEKFKVMEKELTDIGDKYGRNFGSIWIKKVLNKNNFDL